MSITVDRVAAALKSIKNEYHSDQAYGRSWNGQYFVGTTLCDELKRAARNNEPEAINYLFTLACEGGINGTINRSKAATFFLYQLYKTEQINDSLLFKQLGKDSLKLFEIVSARNARCDARINDNSHDKKNAGINSVDGHWIIPAEILCMAKNTANAGSQLHNDIVDQLRACESIAEAPLIDDKSDAAEVAEGVAQPAVVNDKHAPEGVLDMSTKQLIQRGFVEPNGSVRRAIAKEICVREPLFDVIINDGNDDAHNMFASNRMITSAELDVFSAALSAKQKEYQFHSALKISEKDVSEGCIEPQLGELLKNQNKQSVFIPLLFRDHWVLFGMQSNGGCRSGLVFSSRGYLNDAERAYLNKLTTHGGGHHTIAIERDLQKNMPNACGLLVAQAMRSVAAEPVAEDASIIFQGGDFIFRAIAASGGEFQSARSYRVI